MPDADLTEAILGAAVEGIAGAQRPGQHEMAAAVAETLAGGDHLLVQAGTGTGKSLGYLAPALAQLVQAPDDRIVVATATLALQAQIVGRDMPRLLETLEDRLEGEVEVALLKGRSNYVCLHKLEGGYPEDDDAALFSVPGTATGGAGSPTQFLMHALLCHPDILL
mgnify:CR=1 FL=1